MVSYELAVSLDPEPEKYDLDYDQDTGKAVIKIYSSVSSRAKDAFTRILENHRSEIRSIIALPANDVHNLMMTDSPYFRVTKCEPGQDDLLGTIASHEIRS